MELMNDLERACNIVKQGSNIQEKDNAVRALLDGEVDMKLNGAKELLHRRALLLTMLRERKIWGHPGFWESEKETDHGL